MQMCAQLDRRHISTHLSFLIAGQPEGCFADPPTRFRLMVSVDNPHFVKGKVRSVGSGYFGNPTCPLPLGVSNFLLFRWVLRHFLGFSCLDTLTKGFQG